MSSASNHSPIVYFLWNGSNKTYIGYTVNMLRRLRQHKGLLKGGAKYTSGWSNVILVATITGFSSKIDAMRYEWYAKRKWTYRYKGTLNINENMPKRVQRRLLGFVGMRRYKLFAGMELEKNVHL